MSMNYIKCEIQLIDRFFMNKFVITLETTKLNIVLNHKLARKTDQLKYVVMYTNSAG
jgi:hypothetical protein